MPPPRARRPCRGRAARGRRWGSCHRRSPRPHDRDEHERVAQVVPRRREVDQVGVPGEEPDHDQRDVGVEPGGRREPERREVAGDRVQPFERYQGDRRRLLAFAGAHPDLARLAARGLRLEHRRRAHRGSLEGGRTRRRAAVPGRHPERYPWIDADGLVDGDGPRELTDRARGDAVGRCVLLRPTIGPTLPVFVVDRYEGFDVRRFVDLSDDELESYLRANVDALRAAATWHRSDVVVTGHAIPGATIGRRALGSPTLRREGPRQRPRVRRSAAGSPSRPGTRRARRCQGRSRPGERGARAVRRLHAADAPPRPRRAARSRHRGLPATATGGGAARRGRPAGT